MGAGEARTGGDGAGGREGGCGGGVRCGEGAGLLTAGGLPWAWNSVTPMFLPVEVSLISFVKADKLTCSLTKHHAR